MSTFRRKSRKSRPPVDALQYEKLALSAFRVCEQSKERFDTLVTLAASICRNPAVTVAGRYEQRKLLQLLVDTAEDYMQINACDLELFQAIALDAKGLGQCQMTAKHAAELLDYAARRSCAGVTTH